mmetsp:Transcript_15942/g.30238  ORF Transcript_15942/g.30238 Transcript_15942/m.30238 type:complete len:206 (-) Transcript_15942:163-780(-)
MVELCRSRSFRTPLGLQRPRRRTWLSWRPPSPRTPPGRRRGCAPTSPTGARNGRGGGARRQAKSASNKKRRASRWAMGGRDAKDCGLFPLHVTECSFLRGLLGWEAFTFFGVILFADKVPEGDTVRHETIHYLQYRELAFLATTRVQARASRFGVGWFHPPCLFLHGARQTLSSARHTSEKGKGDTSTADGHSRGGNTWGPFLQR